MLAQNIRRLTLSAGTALLCLGAAAPAMAGDGYKYDLGNGAWLSVGAGLRASYEFNDDADKQSDFTLNSARIFTNAQITKVIGFTFNTEIETDPNGDINDIRMMDALVRLEFSDAFNIYGGRMLAPSDRANLDGPYYLGTWEYPTPSIFNYPAIFQGRDNGAAAWGYVADKRLYYSAGVFEGCSSSDSSCANPDADKPLLAGRLTYNFWDRESGYYTSSDYYGEKEVLAVGLVGQFQSDAVTSLTGQTADYAAFNIDFLMQKRFMGNNVFTLEGAYYFSDTEGVVSANPTSVVDGDGFFVLTSVLIDHKVGIGKFQPVFRYQEYDFDKLQADFKEYSVGTNYIIKGHDARLSAIYSQTETENVPGKTDRFVAGVQLQY